jgi:hypothetical protein
MKVGIIGSSHSTGAHKLSDGTLTPTFLSWCEKHKTQPMEFYSCANGGKGSEMFLNGIVHLKDTHDVDIMLIEIIHNRRNINADIAEMYDTNLPGVRRAESDMFRERLKQFTNIKELSKNTFPYLKLFSYKAFVHEELENFEILGSTYKKEENNWKQVQLAIAANKDMTDFWTILDVYQSLKLCKMLGIKTVLWQNSVPLEMYFEHFAELKLLSDIFVTMDEYECSRHYFRSKYGPDINCDIAHLKPEYESELIKNFLMPAINKLITNMV